MMVIAQAGRGRPFLNLWRRWDLEKGMEFHPSISAAQRSAVGMVGTVPTEGDGWAEGRNGPEFSRRRRHGEVTEMPADVNTTRVMAVVGPLPHCL